MKPENVLIMFCLSFLLGLGGCIPIPNNLPSRFYSLQVMNKNQIKHKFSLPSNLIIGVGPVKIPEYQNRPQIVTKNKDNTLRFAQFDRWGEPLDLALEYVISENLTNILPGATINKHPWNSTIPVKYQVILDIIQLESDLDSDMFLIAQWSILDAVNKKMLLIKRSEFRQQISPHSYFGLVETLNKACASLSIEIAQALASLVSQV